MKTIPLNRGYVALVDDDDFDLVSWFNWRPLVTKNRTYAISAWKIDGKWKTIYMHRLILDAKDGQQIRHLDECGLNNQRKNLVLF